MIGVAHGKINQTSFLFFFCINPIWTHMYVRNNMDFVIRKWMCQNILLKILNKATKLCTFQRFVSLYFKDFSVFYVIYYTQINEVFYKSTLYYYNTHVYDLKCTFFLKQNLHLPPTARVLRGQPLRISYNFEKLIHYVKQCLLIPMIYSW